MFLSNPRKFFLIAGFLALILQACGSSAGNENKPVFLTVEKKSEFPFSTKEPEVYQGDFVVGNGNWEEKWFIARKGEKFRIDFRLGTDSMWTEIKSDKIYSVSQTRRIYAEVSGGEFPQNDSTALNFLKDTFFTGLEYRDFDDLGRDGFLKKYRIRPTKFTHDQILISVDEASGLIVRQEFVGHIGEKEAGSQVEYIYEIKNLKLEVDDGVFAIPDGYRKVSLNEFRTSTKKK